MCFAPPRRAGCGGKEQTMTAVPDFDIQACKPMNPEWARENGFTPNRVFTRPTAEGGRIAYQVVRRSARGTFALTKAGMDRLANAAGVTGAVALTEADDSNVLTVPVTEMSQ